VKTGAQKSSASPTLGLRCRGRVSPVETSLGDARIYTRCADSEMEIARFWGEALVGGEISVNVSSAFSLPLGLRPARLYTTDVPGLRFADSGGVLSLTR